MYETPAVWEFTEAQLEEAGFIQHREEFYTERELEKLALENLNEAKTVMAALALYNSHPQTKNRRHYAKAFKKLNKIIKETEGKAPESQWEMNKRIRNQGAIAIGKLLDATILTTKKDPS